MRRRACASSSRSSGPATTRWLPPSDHRMSRPGRFDPSAATLVRGSPRPAAQVTPRPATACVCPCPQPAPEARCRPDAGPVTGLQPSLCRTRAISINRLGLPPLRTETTAPAWSRASGWAACPPSPVPGSPCPLPPSPSSSGRAAVSLRPSAPSFFPQTHGSQLEFRGAEEPRGILCGSPPGSETRIRKKGQHQRRSLETKFTT